MQDQQDIQSAKTWQAPELVELGFVTKETRLGTGPIGDGIGSSTS